MKYKVGDRVRIKSIDWYNENKNEFGDVKCSLNCSLHKAMSIHCGSIQTIESVVDGGMYWMKENPFNWADEMIEGLVEENINIDVVVKETTKDISDKIADTLMGGLMVGKSFSLPEGYQFKDENGNIINATKIVLEKKKKEYPKTYEECCTVLRFHYDHYLTYDDEKDINPTKEEEEFIDLMDVFSRLIVCRNAYWKIYGEESGLGKPWEPDWKKQDKKYIISVFEDTVIYFENETYNRNTILVFPTAEMRDAFYENFKELIEQCKELL